ncbi:DUF3613 domain-containing protein [Comamonas sp. lk]|uniref:DUF3613 domain-containing protein n=1 Tax=Comamonas sp. lk TaxID=2201272 RepID=UPI000EB2B545|nr:DUF3613 domain-containing protein [Comamonas sp. lk]
MQKQSTFRANLGSRLASVALLSSLLAVPQLASVAYAQSVPPVEAKTASAALAQSPVSQASAQISQINQAAPPPTNRVGDATTYLMALQAGGQAASRNIHPVTSDVAQRSYQRYLESFTHKIPAYSNSNIQGSGGSR